MVVEIGEDDDSVEVCIGIGIRGCFGGGREVVVEVGLFNSCLKQL